MVATDECVLPHHLTNDFSAFDDGDRSADVALIFFARVDAEELAEGAEEIGHAHRPFGDGGSQLVRSADHLSAFNAGASQGEVKGRREMIPAAGEIDLRHSAKLAHPNH